MTNQALIDTRTGTILELQAGFTIPTITPFPRKPNINLGIFAGQFGNDYRDFDFRTEIASPWGKLPPQKMIDLLRADLTRRTRLVK